MGGTLAIDFNLMDRWDKPITRLQVLSAKHTEELNGEDTLTIECFEDVGKGQRILWRDHMGKWHEHVVDSTTKKHEDGKPTTVAKCVNSLVETWNDYIDDRRIGISSPASVTTMLEAALEPTRWTLGSDISSETGTVTFYHTSAREAIQDIQEVVGGELETTIEVDSTHVTSRKVSIRATRGNQNSTKRFTYTKDINVLSRTVDTSECVSQLYVYGKGLESEAGGYGRRLTIESVNSGKKYLEDTAAKNIWGRPDGNGGKAHSTGVAVFDNIEDAAELKRAGQKEFAQRKEPKVSYSVDVVDLASMGFTYEGVDIGDSVSVIDTEFDPEIRATARVMRIDRDLLEQQATVTLGNITTSISSILGRQARTVSSLQRRSSSWNLIAGSEMTYLDQLRSALNNAFATNSNYQYDSFELGTLYSNVPCDDSTFKPIQPLPSGVTPWAMNLSSKGFRISSELNANGTWKWTTFGTGEGFVADEIVTGTLMSAAYRETGVGDHWTLGRNGHLVAYDSTFYNVNATGQISSTNAHYRIDVKDGQILMYRDDTLYAHLSIRDIQNTTGFELANVHGCDVSAVEDMITITCGDRSYNAGFVFQGQPDMKTTRIYQAAGPRILYLNDQGLEIYEGGVKYTGYSGTINGVYFVDGLAVGTA